MYQIEGLSSKMVSEDSPATKKQRANRLLQNLDHQVDILEVSEQQTVHQMPNKQFSYDPARMMPIESDNLSLNTVQRGGTSIGDSPQSSPEQKLAKKLEDFEYLQEEVMQIKQLL